MVPHDDLGVENVEIRENSEKNPIIGNYPHGYHYNLHFYNAVNDDNRCTMVL